MFNRLFYNITYFQHFFSSIDYSSVYNFIAVWKNVESSSVCNGGLELRACSIFTFINIFLFIHTAFLRSKWSFQEPATNLTFLIT